MFTEGGPIRDSMIQGVEVRIDASLSRLGGGAVVGEQDRPAVIERRATPLTSTEIRVVEFCANGFDIAQIGAKMGVSNSQIENMLVGIKEEFGRGEDISTTELVVRTIDADIIHTRTLVSRKYPVELFYLLTDKEAQALRQLAKSGGTNEEIGLELGIGADAVKARLSRVYKRTRTRPMPRLFELGERRRAITLYKEMTRRAKVRAVAMGIDPKGVDAFYFKPANDLLSPKQRRYMEMHDQGLKPYQIAELEKVSPSIVRKALYAAREKLKKR